jgi:hypothetical protein
MFSRKLVLAAGFSLLAALPVLSFAQAKADHPGSRPEDMRYKGAPVPIKPEEAKETIRPRPRRSVRRSSPAPSRSISSAAPAATACCARAPPASR